VSGAVPTLTSDTCRICAGRLEFAQRGDSTEYEPSVFRPSHHRVGGVGDLYRCRDCGTVHQPSLPRGRELHDLYRAMSDEGYIREAEGRRRNARWLLDLLAEHVPGGRLLEVGCGYGLLLDEARRRGYEVEGVELSAEAVRYARERLGLPVREMALEDATLEAAADGERYDAVVAVDVLEHLDDPVAALDRLCALLAPGGALLTVNGDPSSLVARVAGSRWWCYEPAHACLIPRRKLRELIHARGLVVVADATTVHSFSLRYWLTCLSERGGRAGGALAYVAARLPPTLMLKASLRDERAMVALQPGRRGAPQPAHQLADRLV
jgi:2-polyprenyl-3-methyl-5-hydroxy-6-metoxy-1,4-benzoquinol methylase